MEDVGDRAVELFSTGLNCAQAVLGAFVRSSGTAEDTAYRMAAGFGAGTGRTGGVCGAVSGGVMALGLLVDYDPRGPLGQNALYEVVQTFMKEFARVHGNVSCSGLLECDIGTAEGFTEALGRGLFTSRCPEFVRTAAELVEELA